MSGKLRFDYATDLLCSLCGHNCDYQVVVSGSIVSDTIKAPTLTVCHCCIEALEHVGWVGSPLQRTTGDGAETTAAPRKEG